MTDCANGHHLHPLQDRVDAAIGMEKVLEAVFPGYQYDKSLQDTPQRFLKYLAEFMQPIDEYDIFKSTFDIPAWNEDPNAPGYWPTLVVQSNIPFRGVCEHHLLPMVGKAALAYLPNQEKPKVLGLSKLTRLVQACGHERPSLQEHIGERIVNLMEQHLKPAGVMLIIKSTHGCMGCRGVKAPNTVTTTSMITGLFRQRDSLRNEVLQLTATEMSMGPT